MKKFQDSEVHVWYNTRKYFNIERKGVPEMDRILSYIYQPETTPEEGSAFSIGNLLRSLGYSHRLVAYLKRDPGSVLLNGTELKLTTPLHPGDIISVCIHEKPTDSNIEPVPLPVDTLYEDEDLIVVNKPAGQSIHPSAGHRDDTLANALAYYYKDADTPFVFRVVNRLDRETSGLVIVAKNPLSSVLLQEQMRDRKIHRTYLAIASGHVPSEITIDAPIARVEGSTIERCVSSENGQRAVTHVYPVHYDCERDLTLCRIRLETGRTHQIRVHMKHISHPLIGDYLYHEDMRFISRTALHSGGLTFTHPLTGEDMSFASPLPEDMNFII